MNTKDKQLQDVIKAMKRAAREEYGFQAPRIQDSKKAYNRKKLKPIKLDDDE